MVDIRLVPLSETHLDAVGALQADPETARFTRFPTPPEPGFAVHWYASYEVGRKEGTKEAFAVESSDGEFLGIALAPHMDPEAAEAELGYIVAPTARGRGVGTELLRQLTRWAFTDRGVQRLTLVIDVDNLGSQGVAEHAGYQLEGVMRSTYFKQGSRCDTQLWSRLPTDPEPS
jgi:RimJ/RimL family protein N-acetyltransferase